MGPGLFISLDGIDGTGKTTQCRRLADRLSREGAEVVTVVDPGGTPLGQQLRTILLGFKGEMSVRSEALLFMASRAQLVETQILPALERGAVVLSDRYVLANVVYQGHAGRLPIDELWSLGRFATRDVMPKLTLILTMDPAAAVVRRGREPDRMESRPAEYHRKVYEGFIAESKLDPMRKLIDAGGTLDEVEALIWAEVEPLFAERRGRA